MSKIRELPHDVSEKIAAGEVIERPSSVVKELLENALDAQASRIQITLEKGGKDLIEVLDNGSGIEPDDLLLTVKRHATSKIHALDDLTTIATFGFRGEALASIAAVSRLSILSRSDESQSAYQMAFDSTPEQTLKPVAYTWGHFLGAQTGTLIRVTNLFYNYPVRNRFLKSDRSEALAIKEWIEKISLTHPEVGFSLISDGRSLLELRAGSMQDRVRAVMGGVVGGDPSFRIIESSTTEASPNGPYHLSLYWMPDFIQNNSKNVFQVVNQRAIKDKLIQQALLSAFKQSLLPGRYPSIVLELDFPLDAWDVNVHPAKTEVKFLNPSLVFSLIQKGVQSLFEKSREPLFKQVGVEPSPATLFKPVTMTTTPKTFSTEKALTEIFLPEKFLPGRFSAEMFSPEHSSIKLTQTEALSTPSQDLAWVGIFFNTYVCFQNQDQVLLMDQHAAHERVRYEHLKKSWLSNAAASSQRLLFPISLNLNKEDTDRLLEKQEALLRLGFEIKNEEGKLTFLSAPLFYSEGHQSATLEGRLQSLCQTLLEDKEWAQGEPLLHEALFEKLASTACHSSIRAGDRMSSYEAQKLLESLKACDHPDHCPHGRPTLVWINRSRFEEWFQRIV